MRQTSAVRCLFAVALFAITASAQVATPLLGYLPDGSRIRPVHGMPAAAAIAARLDNKQDFSNIVPSPSHDYVLVTSSKTGAVFVFTPAKGLTQLAGAGVAPALIVTSPRGSAAVLWFSSNNAQLVTGLPSAPVIRQINASYLRTKPTSLAISDDGKWLAGAWPVGLYVWGQFGQVNRLPLDQSVNALAFFQGRPDLAVAIPGRVLSFKASEGFNVGSGIFDAGDWDLDVAAVAVAPNNARVLLADRAGWIVSIETASGKAVRVGCGCSPEGLFGMGQSAFRLTGIADGSVLLFDSAQNEVLFAPLALSEGENQ